MVRPALLTVFIAAFGYTLSATGCHSRLTQLERVAKDWALTIRASQVIPVYPLTEDLQPGDIFLVQLTVDQQHKIYDKRGFLPLDNHLHRLQPGGYEDFYERLLPLSSGDELPKAWIARDKGESTWENAPNASFPSYSFSVRRGGGMSVAVPVQGVPVGLSLLGSSGADGSITISDAKTIGVDTVSLHRQLLEWASQEQAFLKNFARPTSACEPSNYLRVVTRIYAAKEMDVFLSNASSSAFGTDIGKPTPVDLLSAEPAVAGQPATASTKSYADSLTKLNASIADIEIGDSMLLPGGSVRVTGASARTVSLKDRFATPLVIGYLAFDCPILEGGKLGRPIPAHAVADKSDYRPDPAALFLGASSISGAVYRDLSVIASDSSHTRHSHATQAKASLDALSKKAIPSTPVLYLYAGGTLQSYDPTTFEITANNSNRNYLDVRAYRALVRRSLRSIDQAISALDPAALGYTTEINKLIAWKREVQQKAAIFDDPVFIHDENELLHEADKIVTGS